MDTVTRAVRLVQAEEGIGISIAGFVPERSNRKSVKGISKRTQQRSEHRPSARAEATLAEARAEDRGTRCTLVVVTKPPIGGLLTERDVRRLVSRPGSRVATA